MLLVATTVTASTLAVAPVHYEAPKPKTIPELIHQYSVEYDVSESVVQRVIKCESNGNPNAVGDGGYSYGLVQIHLPSHPTVSKEQALSPEFAIKFLTANLALGNGRMWTCWRMMH